MATKVLNTKQPGDCGYIGFFNGQQFEVYAPTLLKAREQIVTLAGIPLSKLRQLNVVLAERADGTPVVHSTAGL